MPPWITSLFVHPEFVIPGALLLSLPIIIHFINRMRYRKVRWAAMEFLLASQKRNRRRILLEQLLLLLLRIVAVAAIVMLVARPLLDPEQFNLFQGQKTHHVVLLDDSGSMRDRWGETSAFEQAKEVLRKVAAEGERKPDTQTLTLILASAPDQPVFTQQSLNKDFVSRLETTLKTLNCSHRSLDLAAGTEAARKLLAEQKGAVRNFHLISDFRQQDWEEETALAGSLQAMDKEKITVNLVKTVPSEPHKNLGITALTGAVDVAAANVPLRLSATVRNYGDQVAKDVRLTVFIDGKKLPTTEVIDSLDSGKEVTREFDVLFPTTGPHDVKVSLPADAQDGDNDRYLSLNLPDANAVLIVDGTPAASEAFYLADALSPAPGITGFAPSIESVDYLRRHPLDKFQSIFLLNVAELPADVVDALEKYVSAGGGLAWYLGDQVRAAFYNDKLYKEGQGLFPAKLGIATDLAVDDTNPAPDLVFGNHPIFKIFEGEENPFVDLVKVNRYFSLARDWTAPDGTQVIATLRNKAPLVFEHRLGKGKIVTCLTSCGTTWNNWPRLPPTFVSMQLELAKHIARSDQTLDLRTVGEPIQLSLDASNYGPNVEIIRPGEGGREAVTLSVKGADGSPPEGSSPRTVYQETYKNTDEPGLYAVNLRRQDGSEETRRFAFNSPESESRLKLATTDLVKKRLGPDMRSQVQEFGDFSWVQGEETTRDVQDYVLVLLLAILLVEQALALKLSYHPPLVAAKA